MKMARASPIRLNGIGVMVIFNRNSVPWVSVTMQASSTVTVSGHLMRGITDPLMMKNKRSPLGRSLTIMQTSPPVSKQLQTTFHG